MRSVVTKRKKIFFIANQFMRLRFRIEVSESSVSHDDAKLCKKDEMQRLLAIKIVNHGKKSRFQYFFVICSDAFVTNDLPAGRDESED